MTGLAAALAASCAASGSSRGSPGGLGAGDSNGSGGADPGGGSGGSSGGLQVSLSDGGSAGYVEGGRAQVCNDAGCTCVRIASIGHEGIWGACGMYGDSTSAFENWLNTQSTARVDTYRDSKPTLTHAFLAQYDVLIFQWLRDVSDGGSEGTLWQFSPDEINSVAAWVTAGGGIITLSGFDGDGQEVKPLNALLSFTDFAYNTDATYTSDCNGCWGGACALTNWNAGSPIGAHLQQVGIQFGRSITVAADAGLAPTVDCPCPGGHACAVHENVGNGHVFAFTDEWVTYTSQWLGTASCLPSGCTGNTPADVFQVPQFWYNAIKYAASGAQCFVIHNPAILQ